MRYPAPALAALATVALVPAPAVHAGDLTSGNARLTILTAPVPFDSALGDAALITDTAAPDQLYKYCWYYRTEIDARPRLFSELLSPSPATFASNQFSATWTSNGPGIAGGGGRFDASLITLLDDGAAPNQARVRSSLTIRNVNPSPRTFRIYLMVDLDLAGGTPNSSADDTLTLASQSPPTARFTEASTSSFAECIAPGAVGWRIAQGLALRTLMATNGTSDIGTSGASFSGDAAALFQWTLALAPDESVTLTPAFAINLPALPPACRPDFNADAALSVQDIFDFLNAYFASSPAADFNADASVSVQDIFDFLNAYFDGCN